MEFEIVGSFKLPIFQALVFLILIYTFVLTGLSFFLLGKVVLTGLHADAGIIDYGTQEGESFASELLM